MTLVINPQENVLCLKMSPERYSNTADIIT